MHTPVPRLLALDGLRGLAIFMVLVFHGYARWPQALPWAMAYQDVALVRYSHLGVALFFIISGYVILMTLEKCSTWNQFAWQRWLRLFPAMLIVTALIFTTAGFLPERPNGIPTFETTLAGLLFVDPHILSAILGHKVQFLEGTFWSLLVEVQFYIVFGALYFIARAYRKPQYALPLFIGLVVLGQKFIPLNALVWFGWFAMGACLYYAKQQRSKTYFGVACLLLPFSLYISVEPMWQAMLMGVGVYVLFVASIFMPAVARVLSIKPLLFLGFISYPLYLLHENALVALTIKLHHGAPFITDSLTPAAAALLIIPVAYIIARFLEPNLRNFMHKKRFLAIFRQKL